MLIKGATRQEVIVALECSNNLFGGNLEFNNFTALSGKGHFRVTLRVKKSRGEGAKKAQNGRRLISACWHAYGVFLDNLPQSAIVHTAGRVVSPGQPWEDFQAGSMVRPVMLSELCECNGHFQYQAVLEGEIERRLV